MGGDIIKALFPNMYDLSLQQRAAVGDIWSAQGWNLTFRGAEIP